MKVSGKFAMFSLIDFAVGQVFDDPKNHRTQPQRLELVEKRHKQAAQYAKKLEARNRADVEARGGKYPLCTDSIVYHLDAIKLWFITAMTVTYKLQEWALSPESKTKLRALHRRHHALFQIDLLDMNFIRTAEQHFQQSWKVLKDAMRRNTKKQTACFSNAELYSYLYTKTTTFSAKAYMRDGDGNILLNDDGSRKWELVNREFSSSEAAKRINDMEIELQDGSILSMTSRQVRAAAASYQAKSQLRKYIEE